MRLSYDKETDTLTITLSDKKIKESDESRPGVILDYDTKGEIVSIEILDARSTHGQSSSGRVCASCLE